MFKVIVRKNPKEKRQSDGNCRCGKGMGRGVRTWKRENEVSKDKFSITSFPLSLDRNQWCRDPVSETVIVSLFYDPG